MITHFTGNRSPSMTDVIRVNGEVFDLTGLSVKFRMRSESSDELVVDAAATITNMPGTDGAVHYDWAAVDVDTAGRFLFWWNVSLGGGVEQDTPEALITFTEHAPITRALCTLEDIQSYIPGYVAHSDMETDAILMELIESTSTEIHNSAGREFQPSEPNPYSKTFDVTGFAAYERRIFVGDLANMTDLEVEVTQLDGTVLDSLAAPSAAIVGQPRNRQPWEPINYLWFPAGLASSPTLGESNVVTATGNWGFPTVPADIRLACVKLVINRYVRDIAAGGTAFATAAVDADFDLSTAFASAQDAIDSYTFYSIA